MAERSEILFSFVVEGLPADKFALVRMEGHEAISELYRFDVDIVSSDPDIDPDKVVNKACVVVIDRDGDLSLFHGIVSQFDQGDQGPEFVNYHVVLVPRLWNLGLPVQCQIFQEKDVKTIIGDVLKENGLIEDEDFVFRTTETYPKREYVVQYQESDLNFILRQMEHYGIFFFWEHGEKKEKLILADSTDAYAPIKGTADVPFRDARSVSPGGEAVGSFKLQQLNMPKKVILKDYNYRKPSLEIKGEADAVPGGFGTFMEYGNHFKDPDEGAFLATVRAEEIICRRRVFHGEGACRHFRSGATFKLQDHYRSPSNTEYLLHEVIHSGSQLGIIGTAAGGTPEKPSYLNRFTAITSDLLFRPVRVTPKPKVYGFMHAVIDAGGSGEYAEIDDQGRYKVKLPFDLSDAGAGKASKFVRMAQPYSGPGMGMHFPLHKGTEVLLVHLDGDPDRPVIMASIPNPVTGSPVTGANQTQCVIHTGGNNRIAIEDTAGGQRIAIFSPTSKAFFSMGSKLE
jgi:type VI secretion system secreted protein VgrG